MKRYHIEWIHNITLYSFYCEAANYGAAHKILNQKIAIRGFQRRDVTLIKMQLVDQNNQPVQSDQLRLFITPKPNPKRPYAR